MKCPKYDYCLERDKSRASPCNLDIFYLCKYFNKTEEPRSEYESRMVERILNSQGDS